MKKKIANKHWRTDLLFVIFILISGCVIASWLSPVVFARDGLLTKMKVKDYGTQYDLGSTRRHDADVTDIYLLYIGFEKVSVQKEEKSGEMFEGYDLEAKKVLPFLYKWERQSGVPAYRITIGKDKYYFTILSC